MAVQGVRILLFGGMRVVAPSGDDLALPHGSRLLLAMLAVAPEPAVPRDELAAAVWPELEPSLAAPGLAVELLRLARSLAEAGLSPGACLAVDGDAVRLQPGWWCDAASFDAELDQLPPRPGPVGAHQFAALGAAVALGSADFMAGFSGAWCDDRRRVYAARLARALAVLLESAVCLERWPEAIAFAEQLLGIDPLLEPVHRALMLSHWRAGDRRAAVRQYARLDDLLCYRSGTEPSEETTLLYDRVVAESAGKHRRSGLGDWRAPG
jgi:DNA-binding SARP family transcriptional activator